MIDTDARLQEILTAIEQARDSSGLDDLEAVAVTAEGREVSGHQTPRSGVVVVYPVPFVERPERRVYSIRWTIAVGALPQENARPNGQRLNALLDILDAAGVFTAGDEARPTDFQFGPDATITMPGYTVTHTEEHYS